ncbi:MAG: YbaB/EbfC family nucleoid-associated protein [Clostridia bacterium]|nr:YbaB/EbfC family nucleoid-associated protein [Clostridia bacterium]
MKARVPKTPGPNNMQSILRQAQKMQEDAQNLQEDLDSREYEVSAGGGMVKIKMTGTYELTSLEIQPEIVDPDDIETLQDVLTAGFNEAIHRIKTTNETEMGKITGAMNLGLPGMF